MSNSDYAEPHVTYESEREVHTVYQIPLGVVACIVPWNFPMGNFVWRCGQNLIAGNTVIFKTSELTPLCGKLIEEVINSVLPSGVFAEYTAMERWDVKSLRRI